MKFGTMNDSSHSICGYIPGPVFGVSEPSEQLLDGDLVSSQYGEYMGVDNVRDGPVVFDFGNSDVQFASHEPSSTICRSESHIGGSQIILDFENGVVRSADDVTKTVGVDDSNYGSRDVYRVIGSTFVGDSFKKYFRQSGSVPYVGESSLRRSVGGERVEIPSSGFGQRHKLRSFCRSRGRKCARTLKAVGGRVEVDDVRLEDVDRGGGKVVSQWPRDPPDEIKELFGDKGQIYHWIGSLCPTPGNPPRFLQLYIYDTQNEMANRMRHFPEGDSSQLDPEIVSSLIWVLDAHNELGCLFRTTRDIILANAIPKFRIRLFNVVGVREYDFPTSGTLGAIVFECVPNTRTHYDIIIESRDGFPQRFLSRNEAATRHRQKTVYEPILHVSASRMVGFLWPSF
ncbi:hypothetical protein Tco_1480868 [Tanacetum coccineum]